MLTGAAREMAMEKAREKLGVTGENPDYWTVDPGEKALRDQLRYWYYFYYREEQAKLDRIAKTTQKLEDFA